MNRFQISRMKTIVHSIDPAAYLTISEVADVFKSVSAPTPKAEPEQADEPADTAQSEAPCGEEQPDAGEQPNAQEQPTAQ